MLQTFTAEKLNDHGFGRQTFALEVDLFPKRASCIIFESQLSIGEVHKMTGTELWTYFARELMSSEIFKEDRDHCKWFAFMSFTRYYVPPSSNPPSSHSEVVSLTKGHTALGGGGLALCGTGTLHCWAETVDEVVARFTDCRRIDRTKLMDDSAYREYYWANYATGLGAALHELGHTFDLAHSPTGIMSRGFDDIHRFFTVVTPVTSVRGITSACRAQRSCSPASCCATQSPVRRPALECSNVNCSPRHSASSSMPCRDSITEPPAIIVFETAFSRLHVQTSYTTHTQNYDRSEVTTTSTRHKDGVETVSELVAWPDGRVMIHEIVKNMASGKTRMTMSMTKPPEGTQSADMINDSRRTKTASNSVHDIATVLPFQESRYKDGGAHWYRSSAVLLHYHRWLNAFATQDCNKNGIEMTGRVVESAVGLRLVELRKGSVCHHWEFLAESPPVVFTIVIDDIRHLLIENDTELVVMVEDNAGCIFKRKLSPAELRTK